MVSRLVSNKHSVFQKAAQTVGREAAMTGYGTISQDSLGHVITRAHAWGDTVRALTANALDKEAYHSAFSVFRDAIAAEAQSHAVKIGSGESYTGFYKDLIEGHAAIESDLLNNPSNSIEAALDYSKVDWNDVDSKQEYLNHIKEYAKQTSLRDHLGMIEGDGVNSATEISILLHTNNSKEYAAYINTFESVIQQQFQQELQTVQDQAKALGYKGKLTDIKAMEKFKATLSPGDQAVMSRLIEMTNGKINQVDKYILARIHNNHINIQEILTTGKFNGVQLDEKALKAFAALNVYANADAISSAYQNEILTNIGYTSTLKNVDLNSIKEVRIRTQEFETALEKVGYGAFNTKTSSFTNAKDAKSVPLSQLKTKQLRKINFSSIKDENIQQALRQYINLRDHGDTLHAAKMMQDKALMRGISGVRMLGDSDLSNSIGQIYSQYRNVKLAMKVWVRVAKFANWMKGTKVARGLKAAARAQHNLNQAILRKVLGTRYEIFNKSRFGDAGRKARAASKRAKKMANKAKRVQQKAAKQAAKQATAKGQKHVAKLAKKSQKKLLSNAGKQAGKFTRTAANLAAHGTIGTTGAGAAGAGAGGATSGAAGGAAGAAGGGILTVCAMILLIILAISIFAQEFAICINVLTSVATNFNDSLLGKAIQWFADLTWPWEVTDEDRQNVLVYTLYMLQNEEAKNSNVSDMLASISPDASFKGGMAPVKPGTEEEGDVHEYVDEDEHVPDSIEWVRPQYTASNLPTGQTYYVYTNGETGDPISQYSNIKLCLSMAHAFTCPIETQEGIENFTTYALGLWNYLNKHTLAATLQMCDSAIGDGCGEFTYKCNFNWFCPQDCTSECSHEGAHWESAYFHDVWVQGSIYDTSPNAQIDITLDTPNRFYVTSGNSKIWNSLGCIYTTHDNKQRKRITEDKAGLNRGSTATYSPSIMSTLFPKSTTDANYNEKHEFEQLYTSHPEWVTKTNTAYYGDANGNVLTWKVNPQYFNGDKDKYEQCFTNSPAYFALTHGTPVNLLSTQYVTYCASSPSTISGCSNQEYRNVYTKKTETKYCGSITQIHTSNGIKTVHLSASTMCSDDTAHEPLGTLYRCKGHTSKVYCSEYTANMTYFTGVQKKTNASGNQYYESTGKILGAHASLTSCGCGNEKSLFVYTMPIYTLPTPTATSWVPPKTKIYICQGHTNHGVFSVDSPYLNACYETVPATYNADGTEATPAYEVTNYNYLGPHFNCNGYQHVSYVQSGVMHVCLGHLVCNGHHTCPGHTLTYCKGHISYQIERTSILENSEAIYTPWPPYTVTNTYWFITTETTYEPLKDDETEHSHLARDDWAGWTDSNKEMALAVYYDDWYQKYQIGLNSFIGGQCSPSEKQAILNELNINQDTTTEILLQNVHFALDACGKVRYYPGDKAVAPAYDEANKFNTSAPPVFDVWNVQHAVHGLDTKYFADWVYRSTHDNASLACLTSTFSSNTRDIAYSGIQPGTPIVYQSPDRVYTGIFLGFSTAADGTLLVKYVGIWEGDSSSGGWVSVITEQAAGWKFSLSACM